MGLRFKVDAAVLPGVRRRADIVFAGQRVAVFVDGCFWHGCPIHGTWSKSNAEFWRNKIETNRTRDTDTNRRLAEAGWKVIRVWEHEPLDVAAPRIASAVIERRTRMAR
jgi:DNA mismatch endonuclease (patch repair protein)